jgi:hypothetical protein
MVTDEWVKLNVPSTKCAIYYYQLVDHNRDWEHVKTHLRNHLAKHREKDDDKIKLCQVTDGKTYTKSLYVGSVTKTYLRARVKQHTGLAMGSTGTYAMWLKEWIGDDDTEIEFRLTMLELTTDKGPEVIRDFEAALWKDLKPVLGQNA